MTKADVRRAAHSLGLVTANKPESFEICFVPDDDYVAVLERHLEPDHPALSEGPVILEDGTRVGSHPGYSRFTVGQRRGLPGGFPEPMYVLEIRTETRAVVIGPRTSLDATGLIAGAVNWLAEIPPTGENVGVRVRHGAPIVSATLEEVGPDSFRLGLTVPQSAVTPGQSAVLYRGDVVLGGGVILGSEPG
jgi:tRNA-specific 2-thiouridylase